MEKIKHVSIKKRTKISVKDTLLSIPKGETVLIKNKMIKISTLRGMIYILKKEGHDFDYSEAGRIDDVLVTRIK
jgi:hypothetical protein